MFSNGGGIGAVEGNPKNPQQLSREHNHEYLITTGICFMGKAFLDPILVGT